MPDSTRVPPNATPVRSSDVSALLNAWSRGDEAALNDLVAIVYPELRRLARHQLRGQPPDHTLESAALANEAYLKLIRSDGIRCEDRVQFFALCATVIRRIVVDYARRRRSAKRGGDAVRVPVDESVLGARARGIDLLALDQALASLATLDPRKGRVVELRYFGGLSVDETANLLKVSSETVMRDWKMAKAWLLRELTRISVR
jgi:RNA polymerase sigma factor (TIGR02999 family)